jgi:thiol-disulfide isomerase/thioredoxin
MKNKLILLLTLIVLFSCNSKKNNRTVLTGKIDNLDGEVYLESTGLKHNCEMTGKGDFKIVLDISQSNYFKLKTNKTEILLFLFPGDSININFDNNNWISKIQYSGNRTNELTYLLDYAKLYNSVADTFDIAKYYSLEPDKFLKTVDSYKQLFIDRLAKNDKLDKEFKGFENQRILYIWSWDKNTYPKNHFLYAKQKAQLPNDYFDYIKELDLNDSVLMRFSDYTDFLKTYVDLQYYQKVENDNQNKYDRNFKTKLQLDIINNKFSNSKIRDYLLNNVMLSQIEDLAVDSTDLAIFNSLCTNQEFKSIISTKFNSISSLLKGRPAPKFSIVSQSNKVISLDDFRGKYLYIDFWATYCAPCIIEMPYLNKLENDFKGKNIVFLGLCIESKKEQWEKIISVNKPSGMQVWLDKEQTDMIKNDFKVTAEPTYILIDKDGNYIDSRAPRPSENIRDILNGLKGI